MYNANHVYRAPRLKKNITLDGDWHKPAWQAAAPALLENFMGARPAHFPKTQFRLAYDAAALYVIFRVEDRYVRAATQAEFHGNVCHDSCVEFFFTPNPAAENIYFNIETNCGGALLFHWQDKPRGGRRLAEEDCAKIKIFHNLPRTVDPEITQPTTWVVEYRVPLEIIRKYAEIVEPKPGAYWRANFYKCADKTSHPHWLTWAPVQVPKPDFHRPEWFGRLEFVD